MHVVSVMVTVKPDLLEEFERAILHNARESMTRDRGCVRFDVSQAYDEPTRWLFHEVWRTPDDHAAHRQSAHFLEYQLVEQRAVVDKQVTKGAGRHVTP
jgi:quinol monooxygenase YgiN